MKRNVLLIVSFIFALIANAEELITNEKDEYLYVNEEGDYSAVKKEGFQKTDIKHNLYYYYQYHYLSYCEKSFNNPGVFIPIDVDTLIVKMVSPFKAKTLIRSRGIYFDSKKKMLKFKEKEDEGEETTAALVPALLSLMFMILFVIANKYNRFSFSAHSLVAALFLAIISFFFAIPFLLAVFFSGVSIIIIFGAVLVDRRSEGEEQKEYKDLLLASSISFSLYFVCMFIGI